MNPSIKISIACVISFCLISPVAAEDRTPPKQFAPRGTPKADMLTGKERLGPKWTDEQRIDNCNVPPDKRGTKARPIACADQTN